MQPVSKQDMQIYLDFLKSRYNVTAIAVGFLKYVARLIFFIILATSFFILGNIILLKISFFAFVRAIITVPEDLLNGFSTAVFALVFGLLLYTMQRTKQVNEDHREELLHLERNSVQSAYDIGQCIVQIKAIKHSAGKNLKKLSNGDLNFENPVYCSNLLNEISHYFKTESHLQDVALINDAGHVYRETQKINRQIQGINALHKSVRDRAIETSDPKYYLEHLEGIIKTFDNLIIPNLNLLYRMVCKNQSYSRVLFRIHKRYTFIVFIISLGCISATQKEFDSDLELLSHEYEKSLKETH